MLHVQQVLNYDDKAAGLAVKMHAKEDVDETFGLAESRA